MARNLMRTDVTAHCRRPPHGSTTLNLAPLLRSVIIPTGFCALVNNVRMVLQDSALARTLGGFPYSGQTVPLSAFN